MKKITAMTITAPTTMTRLDAVMSFAGPPSGAVQLD